MINENCAQRYCAEDLALIEGYAEAVADTTQMWDIHHRLEILGDKVVPRAELIAQGLYWNRPASELIFLTHAEHAKLHASNLSDKTRRKLSDARRGRHLSEETKRKIGDAQRGEKNHLFGKHHSEEARRKMSEAHRGEKAFWFGKHQSEEHKMKNSEAHRGLMCGENHPFFGKHLSEEHRRKISEARCGKYCGENHPMFGRHHSEETRRKMSEAALGIHWWTDGKKSIRARECPGPGWVRGRLRRH